MKQRLELQHRPTLIRTDDVIPPIVINSSYRGQMHPLVVPLNHTSHRTFQNQLTNLGSKNILPSFNNRQYTLDQFNLNATVPKSGIRMDRLGSANSRSNATGQNYRGPKKPIMFAPGLYCKRLIKDQYDDGNSHHHDASSAGKNGLKMTSPLTDGIVGTMFTGRSPSHLNIHKSNNLSVEWSAHHPPFVRARDRKRALSATTNKRKMSVVK